MYLGKTALNKSKYTTDANCNTHYGIGQMNYTHWTSPIRRLPDLLNHCKLLGYSFTNTELNQYLNNMNKMEKKQEKRWKKIRKKTSHARILLARKTKSVNAPKAKRGCNQKCRTKKY